MSIVGFLVIMTVIKTQSTSALDRPYGRVTKISSIRNYTVGANMGYKRGHFSGGKAFPKVRIRRNGNKHVEKALMHPKGHQGYQNKWFHGIEGGH